MACGLANSWEIKVTKLLLADFDGRAKFNNKFRTNMFQNNLMKGGVSFVQGKLKSSSKFLVFEKEGRVKYASVFLKDATICCKFRKPSTQTCREENCSEYHVCKFFVSGHCIKGSSCHFGHDLQNEANAKVSERLGMSSFSADEIRTVIFRSNPAVCVKYNAGGCDDPDCPDLHVCSFFVLRTCKAGNDCKFQHALGTSEHNKWVLDAFRLGHLTEMKLRKCIIVQHIFRAVPKVDAESQPQMTQAASSLSLVSDSAEVSEEKTEGYILNVFSFLIKQYGGRTKFNTFLANRGKLLKRFGREDIIKWFKHYSDQFILYEKDGEVTYVAPFNKRARACFFYSEPGTLYCQSDTCKYLHVCRAFVAGVCWNGKKCGLCHSFSSGPNSKVLSELELEQFSDSEVRNLVLCSNPAVCVNHNASGCNQKDCPDLHVCSKYILKKCTSSDGDGDDCKFGHKMRDSEHNRHVLKTFRMEAWSENVLRKIVIVKGEYKQTLECAAFHYESEIASPCSTPAIVPHPGGQQAETLTKTNIPIGPTTSPDQKAKTDNDTAVSELVKDTEQQRCASPSEYEHICETYTWTGACSSGGDCPRYHSPDRVPYLWMIQLGDMWLTLNSVDSVQLEKSFCDVASFCLKITLERLGTQSLLVDFRAMSSTCSSLNTLKLRRLSTPSYVAAAPETPLSFYTQWLWYRRERTGRYTPFFPGSLQYTLEEKYLKGQSKYYFEFKDLRLMVNTQSSPMVQVNLDTQRCASVIRRPEFVQRDESKPPLLSSLLLDVPPPLPHQVPDHWSVVDHFQDAEVVELRSEEAEFRDVYRQFFSTMSETEYKITNIFRVQNPGLWEKYCLARRAMTPRGERPEDVEERQLFHGTPTLLSARGICANSFDFRRAGENVGAIYGKGAYFSTTARYSHSYTRTGDGDPVRFMFLGRILVGQYTLGHPSFFKPPERDRLKLYDSCVNDMTTPSIFVIFDLAQSYPEYLIHYLDDSPSSRSTSDSQSSNQSTGPSPAADMQEKAKRFCTIS